MRGEPYICPVRPSDSMLMIHVDDLAAGLVALMNAPPGQLQEPTAGYAIGGFHFSPAQLFGAISTVRPPHHPSPLLRREATTKQYCILFLPAFALQISNYLACLGVDF